MTLHSNSSLRAWRRFFCRSLRRWKRGQRFGYLALIAVVVHLVALGLGGWLEPAGWNGGLPPISLVAFSFFFVGYVINIFGRE